MYVVLIALFVAFLWGIQPLVQKNLLKNINFKIIMIVGGMFYAGALLLFSVYNWKSVKKDMYALSTKSVAMIGITSIACAFIANLLYLYILKDHKSYVISALIYSSPLFTLLLAHAITGENINVTSICGVLLIVAGVFVLSTVK